MTHPESPAIKKRRRLDTAGRSDAEDANRVQIKANPVPNFDKVFEPQYPQRMVVPEPFSFEERDKNKNTRETLVQKNLREDKVRMEWQHLSDQNFRHSAIRHVQKIETKNSL